jgi:hypothetical protein
LGRIARLGVVGDASRSALALFQPVAVAVHLEDVNVVSEPVTRSEANTPVRSSNGI